MKKDLLRPVRGMRDFYPPEMRKRNTLFHLWLEAAEQFGFEPYDASIVESLDLLKRKAGEEIAEQIYFFSDKSGRELALRPEMTPSLARMILANHSSLSFPVKWYFIGQCFRYERMTVGRKREHYQLNLDVLGEPGPLAEAEVIAAALAVLKRAGLSSQEVKVRLGSRQLLVDILRQMSFEDHEMQVAFSGLDKRGKISDEEMGDLFLHGGLTTEKVDRLFSLLALHDYQQAKSIIGDDAPSIHNIDALMAYAQAFGIDEFLEFDIAIVRGLAYYTGIVFECFDRERRFRAIFGGGRYDTLFASLGGINVPAVGLGFGDVVVDEVLKYYQHEISSSRQLDYLVCYTTADLERRAIAVCNILRQQGHRVLMSYGAQRMKKALKLGHQQHARRVAILDPQEADHNQLLVKDLAESVTTTIPLPGSTPAT